MAPKSVQPVKPAAPPRRPVRPSTASQRIRAPVDPGPLTRTKVIDNSKFGLGVADTTPQSLYLRGAGLTRSSGGNTGSVTTKRELGIVVNDYFDYQSSDGTGIPQYVSNYFWENSQNLFDTAPTAAGATSSTFCRVRKVEVWVLPQARGTYRLEGENLNANTNAQQMYTVNVQTPAAAMNSSIYAVATNTQVTNVLPAIDTKWKKVFTCDLQRTFQSGVVLPFFDGTNQCLFSMSILDPTTGLPYQTGNADQPDPGIRVRVQLTIDQPISTFNEALLTIFRNEDFSVPSTAQNGVLFPGPLPTYVQMDLRRSLDNFR